jgi:opacity protein-like surface antigen
MYSQKGNKFNGESIMQKGIEVPVNLKYSLGFGSLASVFVAAGPSAFFNWNSGTKELPIETSSNDYKPFELSFNIGAGVKVLKHLQIGINYNIPVTNSAIIKTVDSATESSFKTRVWQTSIAYMF